MSGLSSLHGLHLFSFGPNFSSWSPPSAFSVNIECRPKVICCILSGSGAYGVNGHTGDQLMFFFNRDLTESLILDTWIYLWNSKLSLSITKIYWVLSLILWEEMSTSGNNYESHAEIVCHFSAPVSIIVMLILLIGIVFVIWQYWYCRLSIFDENWYC